MNVSRLMRGASAVLVALGLVTGAVSTASAEGFAISTLSARGGSFGGGAASGMVARADDASAVAYNPAGLTQVPGTQIMAGLAAVALNLDLDTSAGWCSNSHQVWPIPHGYISHQLNDKIWLGAGMFTRWGLGHSYPDGWAARGLAEEAQATMGMGSALKSITLLTSTINPTIAYKINDVWSVAAGVSYTWGYLSLNNQLYGPNGMGVDHVGDVRVHSENGRSFGYNLAVHAKFNEQWSAGLTYRSHERMKFNGSSRIRGGGANMMTPLGSLNIPAETLAAKGGLYNSRGKATIVLPDVITLGVAYKPTDRLSFEADVAYTVWSRWRNLQVDLLGSNPNAGYAGHPLFGSFASTDKGINQQKNWRDTWALSFSAEYWALDWLALRAGFLYETSPLNGEAYNDYFIPTNGRLQYSAGFGLKYENWTLDFAYIYMQEREVNLSYAKSNGGVLTGKFGNGYDHTFALTLGYKF
ncbi:MAG: outer membrane protein transport protein [Mailhella sp.]|nr:outer membrane protein transport protein [Mailhella sp.]